MNAQLKCAADTALLVIELNRALSAELCAIAMYTTYAAKVLGPVRPALAPFLRDEVEDESKHASYLAERIVALGGEPTTRPDEVPAANTTAQMIGNVLKAETEAVERYTALIRRAEEAGQKALAVGLENVLTDELEHRDETMKISAGLPTA